MPKHFYVIVNTVHRNGYVECDEDGTCYRRKRDAIRTRNFYRRMNHNPDIQAFRVEGQPV